MQSYVQGITLASFTGIRMPALVDRSEDEPGYRKPWKFLYLERERAQVELLHDHFMAELRMLSEEIEALNETRPKFQSCNPAVLECSVNV